jgi:hypothetical protein
VPPPNNIAGCTAASPPTTPPIVPPCCPQCCSPQPPCRPLHCPLSHTASTMLSVAPLPLLLTTLPGAPPLPRQSPLTVSTLSVVRPPTPPNTQHCPSHCTAASQQPPTPPNTVACERIIHPTGHPSLLPPPTTPPVALPCPPPPCQSLQPRCPWQWRQL